MELNVEYYSIAQFIEYDAELLYYNRTIFNTTILEAGIEMNTTERFNNYNRADFIAYEA